MRLRKSKKIHGMKLSAFIVVVCLLVTGNLCFSNVTASEISRDAQKMKLDNTRVIFLEAGVKFIQADLRKVTLGDIEKGKALGILEIIPGDSKSNLGAGKNIVYLKRIGSSWLGFALSGNKVVPLGRANVVRDGGTRSLQEPIVITFPIGKRKITIKIEKNVS